MKILFLSGLYSSPLAPGMGVANTRILHAMRSLAEIRVVAPVPWYPAALAQRVPRLRPMIELPRVETDDDGTPVLHPRRLHVPHLHALQAGLYSVSVAKPVWQAARAFQPDVLLSSWAYPDGTAAVALGKLLRLPTIVRVTGSDINDAAQKPRRRPQIQWAMRNAGRVIAVSAALGGELEKLGVSRQRIAVVPTGIDRNKFHPLDRAEARKTLGLGPVPSGGGDGGGDGNGERVILVPSRLSPEKGIHYFLDALAHVVRTDTGVRALIVGNGKEEAPLRAQAERLGIAGHVRFEGFQAVERMKIYYAAADLTCLPSTEEGWPNVLVESFACGCPVVASDVGGVPEIMALLADGGTVVPPADAESLTNALAQGLRHPYDRAAIAEAMLAHTIENTARSYFETCTSAYAEARN